MDLLVFQAAPQPLDKDGVQPAPAAVHVDPHPGGFQFVKMTRNRSQESRSISTLSAGVVRHPDAR
jgi:hypothetical protein